MRFSEINVKAAAVTGAFVGVLCWLLVFPFGYSNYGMMGYMFRYPFHALSGFSIIIGLVAGTIFGAAVALAYNWALKLE